MFSPTTAAHIKVAKKFITKLKKLQKALDLPNAEFADLIESKPRTVRSWFAGEVIPPIETIERAEEALIKRHHSVSGFINALEGYLGA